MGKIRFAATAFLLTIIGAVVFFFPASAQDVINVTINGRPVVFGDQPPAIVDGRTMVPVRGVFEALGFAAEWNASEQVVTLRRGGDVIVIIINAPEFAANGETYDLEVPAQIINGRTMLPIRDVLESVGYNVGWNAATNTVVITTGPPVHGTPGPLLTIPNRRLTDAELEEWRGAYSAALNFENEVIRLINTERAAQGLQPLTAYTPLMMAARFKSQSMYDLNYFEHESPIYGSFYNIAIELFGVTPRALGENIAEGHRTPDEVVGEWMASPGHRENILNPEFGRIGVGFHNYRWTQKFMN
jgi:uncharacterized protein YkwD